MEPQPSPGVAAQMALAGKQALLILDSAEEADDLRPIHNIRGDCGVLVTSRRRQDALSLRQDVPPLDDEAASELLQAFLQRILNPSTSSGQVGGGRIDRGYGLGRQRTDTILRFFDLA